MVAAAAGPDSVDKLIEQVAWKDLGENAVTHRCR